ncbi:hypothetical protein KO561_12880 [Radiobacillus kanasensis]|uniref:hypothetical protein n=1 Tax=Radiobacillus kanasensis TaxID=2844358 RepID=UPI001E45B940|nr:hypothetical protein [Radiobacillus kanasensis]UFT98096.1 hypothetical protein KO561_12880 [Radiobacillus kanasensis]
MKVKVLRLFEDKKTEKVYHKKDFYEGDEEYIKGLHRLGFVEADFEEEEGQGHQDENPSVLNGSVDEVKEAVKDLEPNELKKVLAEETAGKNRKGVVEYIKAILDSIQGEGA